MKTIEERARLAAYQIYEEIGLSKHSVDRVSEIIAEKMIEQKFIDDAECINKVLMGKGSSITYNGEANYKQGYNDAIKKACNVFCYTGCPHKTDFYNCLNDKCDTWKIFKKMMEE